MKVESVGRSVGLVSGFVISAISLILFFGRFVFFQTNDDFTQMLILSGLLYGEPSSEAMYLSKVISEPIKWLYLLFGGVGWYGLFLILIQTISVLLVLSLVIKSRLKVILFILIYLMFLPLFVSLQYTQASLIAAGAGVIAFSLGEKKWQKIMGVVLIFLAVSLRFESGLLGVIVAAGVYLLVNKKFEFKKLIVVGVVIFAGFVINMLPQWIGNSSTDYKYYGSLAKILDYDPTGQMKAQIANEASAVGWSRNDFRLLNEKFYFADREIFTVERNDVISESVVVDNFYFLTLRNLAKIIFIEYFWQFSFFIVITSLGWLLFSKLRIVQLPVLWLFTVGVFYLVLIMGRLPYRIVIPVLFVGLLAFVASLSNADNQIFKWRELSVLLAVPLIVIHLNEFKPIFDEEMKLQAARDVDLYEFNRLLEYQPDRPVVAFSSFYSVVMKTFSPNTGPEGADNFYQNLIFIGWTIRSEANNEYLSRIGISENLFDSIAQGDAYLATGDHEVELKLVTRYLRQNRGIDITWEPGPTVYNQSGLGLWKVKSYQTLE